MWSMVCKRRSRLAWSSLVIRISSLLLLCAVAVSAQQDSDDWKRRLHEQVQRQQVGSALGIVEQRLVERPEDLEAHGWRARLLAWSGRWPEAETEYRHVLAQAPNDTDILSGLADVLVWQQRPQEALQILDRAHSLSPAQSEILVRRARVLRMLGRTAEARTEFRQALALDPHNQEARTGLSGLRPETKHELRVGADVDSFNYTDAATAQSLTLSSRWSQRWSTLFGINSYQRFREDAAKITVSTAFRFRAKDWLSVGGSVADDHGVIPKNEALIEYGHGFQLQNRWIRGLEASYQQHWLQFRGAQVLTVGVSQLFYLPKEWTWALTVTGARSEFSGSGIEWVPSGSTQLGFPLYRRLTANLSFGVGSENFAEVDQIGRFSARTFGGGLRYRFAARQDISGYVASQDRSQSRSQNSFGLSYGIRF